MDMSQFVIPRKVEIPNGAYGVWQIPELNIVIPVYSAANRTQAQAQVDRENSASIYKHGVGRVIADHAQSKAGKGIWDVGQFRPDMVGFLVTPKVTYQYVCIQVCRVNVHPTCYTLDGVGIYPKRSTDIMCASCANAKGTENYLAIFKYKGNLPR